MKSTDNFFNLYSVPSHRGALRKCLVFSMFCDELKLNDKFNLCTSFGTFIVPTELYVAGL